MGSPPKRGLPKFKLFDPLRWKHEVFEVTEYKTKMKFGGAKMGGFLPKRSRQNSNFLAADTKHMRFSA